MNRELTTVAKMPFKVLLAPRESDALVVFDLNNQAPQKPELLHD